MTWDLTPTYCRKQCFTSLTKLTIVETVLKYTSCGTAQSEFILGLQHHRKSIIEFQAKRDSEKIEHAASKENKIAL
jgi:hypothetical protein